MIFDADYWKRTDKTRPMTCRNCGHTIIKNSYSVTGWTHAGQWEGVRCQNATIRGAQPVSR